MSEEPDRTQLFGRIAFAAVVLLVVGVVVGVAFDSVPTFGVFTALAVITFASTLLLLREGD